MKQIHSLLFLFLCSNILAQTLPSGPQVLTFFSDLDDSEQPYAIYIPKDYDDTKKYPLVVMLHGAGSNHRLALRRVFGKSNIEGETDVEASLYFPKWKDVEYIVAAPYARGTAGYEGFVEKDVLDMLDDVKQRFPIDENRMYLTGLSMGGGGTLWIGLSHPDLWAAIAPVCPAPPPGTDALAPNALNMAVHFFHGDADPTVPISISRDWAKNLRALGVPVVEITEFPGVGHESWVGAYENERIFKWFSKFTRDPYPNRVTHAAHDLEHGKAYWVRIDEKMPGEVALIEAAFVKTTAIEIHTEHISAFTLLLADHPQVPTRSTLEITIDAQHFQLESGSAEYAFSGTIDTSGKVSAWQQEVSSRSAKTKSTEELQKQESLEGPIADAFASRHVYVYGTADNPTPEVLKARIDTALKAADWSQYRGEFLGRIKFFPRVLADREVRPSDYASAHLILFGTVESNLIIAAHADKLPLQLKKEYEKASGLVYIFPNNHGRYCMINSGLPWWHARDNSGWRFLPEAHTSLSSFKDFILFKRDKTVIAEGYFDNDWRIPTDVNALLMDSGVVRGSR